jgi:hypothetical protein
MSNFDTRFEIIATCQRHRQAWGHGGSCSQCGEQQAFTDQAERQCGARRAQEAIAERVRAEREEADAAFARQIMEDIRREDGEAQAIAFPTQEAIAEHFGVVRDIVGGAIAIGAALLLLAGALYYLP